LIFVKNIPTYMANRTIPKLYNEYGAFHVKNVYPQASITTAVVSFRTKEEAARAQKETDGMRFLDVILRVEMYEKHRSVRFIRDSGPAQRPLGAIEDDDEATLEEEVAFDTKHRYTPPLDVVASTLPNDAPKGMTWAHVAADKGALTVMSPPSTPEAALSENKIVTSSTPVTTPRTKVAVPHILFAPSPAQSDHHRLKTYLDRTAPSNFTFVPSLAARGNNKPYNADTKSTSKLNNPFGAVGQAMDVPRHTSVWKPIDTAELIRQRHCQGCSFCQLRTR
ncbi:uncharacterized protein K460DRAFT_268704, partial [Cucurbitaria berberidis CBS 394.84]